FNLKSLEEAYIPNLPRELKEALGKEIKLTKGSLYKIVEKGREKYIPQMKQTLQNPDFALRDRDNMLILAKQIEDKQYFTSVNLETKDYFISVSNAPKKENILKNKVENGAEILYQSPNAKSIFYTDTLLQTDKSSANKIDEDIIAQNAKSESEKEVLERQIPFIEAEIQKYEAKIASLDERIKKTQTRIQPYLDEINALQKQYDELYFTETRGEEANAKKWLKLEEIKAKQEELRKPYNDALFKFVFPYQRLKGKVQTEIQKLKFGLQDRALRLEEIQNEALNTSKAQKAWLEAFNLKSLEEAYTPNFKAEVKEAINRVLGGEEIKLTKGSFEKLLKRDREEFLPYIKDTLEKADLIIKDKENALIFVKDIGKKSYFTSVAKNANNEWVISTNSLKTLNTLKNRVDDNGEVLYLSKEAPNILAEAFTKRAFSNELAKDIIPQKPQQKALNLQEIEQTLKARKSQINDEISANDKAFKENLKEVSKVKPILEALKKEWEALEPTIVTWTHTDYSKAKPKKYYKRKPNLSNLWHIEETLDVYKGYARESDRHANQVAREIALLEKYVKLLKDKEAEVKAFKAKAEADENALILESRIIPIYNQLREAFKKGHHTTKQILEANNIKQDSVQAKEVIDSIAQTRQYLEDTFNIKPLEEFGTNYAEFYKDGKGAVEKLLAEKQGQVAGAFYKEGLGEIDLVWGDENFGLRHIIDKHGDEFEDIAAELDEIIAKGVLEKGEHRYFIKHNDYKGMIALDYKGKESNAWILTLYKDKSALNPAYQHQIKHNTNTSSETRANGEFENSNIKNANLQKEKVDKLFHGDAEVISAQGKFNELEALNLTDEDIIPQQKIKFAMEKFHYDEKKAKDLLEWHKNSHALTKDENGLPKVFYHGSKAKFEVFEKDFDKTNLGFWFSPDDNTTIYGKEKYPVFLKGDFLDLTKKETYLLNLFHKITPEIKNLKTKNLELFVREIMDKKDIVEKFKTFLKSYGINGIVMNERMIVVFD
ncbi:PBECR2 nuclease fold domain-containing protein, partial [Campylobacter upsaliensis]